MHSHSVHGPIAGLIFIMSFTYVCLYIYTIVRTTIFIKYSSLSIVLLYPPESYFPSIFAVYSLDHLLQ
jgi:hypothetical protein